MSFKDFGRRDLAIINRSFWPIYPVIGEALLRFAEGIAPKQRVSVIMQDHANIRSKLAEQGRGRGVEFFPCKAWSTSSSGVVRRVLDAVFFMLWVLAILLWTRPRKVYVSTDPPVVVPFIVMVYSKLFRAGYVYHLQDIHPEAADVVFPVNRWLFSVLRWMDSSVMRNASALITITDEMAKEIRNRSRTQAPIHVVNNPAVSFEEVKIPETKIKGFSFCGNAGRLQRIPLLVESIEQYLNEGGALKFAFAGGGIFAPRLRRLLDEYAQVDYRGVVSAAEAAQLNADFEWALLPIEDAVTRFAFPSKSSSYVFSGARIMAVCGSETSVAQWVRGNRLGLVVKPSVPSLVQAFRDVEADAVDAHCFSGDRASLKEGLAFDHFVAQLNRLVVGTGDSRG